MKALPGSHYIHYKNKKEYCVLTVAVHTETMEEMVVYQGMYDDPEYGHNPVWVRPRTMFEEQVEYQGQHVDRFTKIET